MGGVRVAEVAVDITDTVVQTISQGPQGCCCGAAGSCGGGGCGGGGCGGGDGCGGGGGGG